MSSSFQEGETVKLARPHLAVAKSRTMMQSERPTDVIGLSLVCVRDNDMVSGFR